MAISIGGHNGLRLGEVGDILVHGFPGCGIYGLYIILKVNAGNLRSEAFLSQLHCRVELASSNMQIGNGFLESHPIVRWTEYSESEQLGFHFYLSGSQIEAIESYRCSRDIKFGIWLSGAVQYEGETQNFSDRSEYLIPKQKWIDAMKAMNYQDSLLFEFPMHNPDGPIADEIRKLLERAQSHIFNGHYQESVGLCRQVIEMAEKARNDKDKASAAVSKYKENRQEMNIEERMLFLREVLKNITQLGAHHSDEFSRYQAHAVLGMTVSLLSSPEIGIKK